MRGAAALSALVLVAWAGAALAEAPTASLRPKARPSTALTELPPIVTATTENVAQPGALRPRARPLGIVVAAAVPVVQPLAASTQRPRPRPAGLDMAAAAPAASRLVVMVAQAGSATPRPRPRPAGLDVTVASAAPAPTVQDETAAPERRSGGLFGAIFGGGKAAKPRSTAPVEGSVCGDPAIRGEDIARVTSKVQGCGIEEPVRVTSIDGIRLNTPATIDCTTATALRSWIDQGLRPAYRGKEIVELRIAASYICRPRNNIRGNKISEHGRGKAVDVAGIVFGDGSTVSVAGDYGGALRKAHKAACGIFGTTLGPGSDGYHEDHLHFDTASYRSGPYCR